jgi:hypothetical protein
MWIVKRQTEWAEMDDGTLLVSLRGLKVGALPWLVETEVSED